jgi:hypothetical protein
VRLTDFLGGTKEMKEVLGGVSDTQYQNLKAREGFPDPVAVFGLGAIWARHEVQAWADQYHALRNGKRVATAIANGWDGMSEEERRVILDVLRRSRRAESLDRTDGGPA